MYADIALHGYRERNHLWVMPGGGEVILAHEFRSWDAKSRPTRLQIDPAIHHGHATVRPHVLSVVQQDWRFRQSGQQAGAKFIRDAIQQGFEVIVSPKQLSWYRPCRDSKGTVERCSDCRVRKGTEPHLPVTAQPALKCILTSFGVDDYVT